MGLTAAPARRGLPGGPDGGAGGLDLTISTGDQAASEAAESGEQEFIGRTPALLLARKLFFQQCLAGFNIGLSKDEMLALYKQNLGVIRQVFAAETANTQITINQLLSDTDSDNDTVTIQAQALPPPPQVGTATGQQF